jgi:serine/threonine protein kinase
MQVSTKRDKKNKRHKFYSSDSIAKTKDAGCRPYMAPERIDPEFSHKGYDVRSDVWSLGITLMEVATGK